MSLIKIKKVIGSSPDSFEQALREIVKYTYDQKKNVTGAKIKDQSVRVENGKIIEYKVVADIAYLWRKELHNE